MNIIIISSIIGGVILLLAIIVYFWNLKSKKNNKDNCAKKIKTDKVLYKNHKIIPMKKANENNSGIVLSSGIKFFNTIKNNFVIKNLNKNKQKKIDVNKLNISISSLKSAICIAPPGSGKTQGLLLPTIYYNILSKDKPFMIISDPKGEILENLNGTLKANNYKVINISLIENKMNNKYLTEFWNPLDNLKKIHKLSVETRDPLLKQEIISQISSEIDYLIGVFEKINTNDKENNYWNKNGISLIKFMLCYMLLQVEENDLTYEHINFKNLLNNLINSSYKQLVKISKSIKNSEKNYGLFYAIKNYLSWTNESENNIKSFISTATTMLMLFDKIYFALLTSKSTFDIDELITNNKPTAIFLTINTSSISTSSDNLLLSLYLEIINKKIDYHKKHNKDFKEKKVWWFLDEAGNIQSLDFLDSATNYGRGLNIFALSIFQSYDQIKQKYSESLINGCEYRILFNNDSTELAKKISDLSGKYLDDRNQYINKLNVDKIANIPNGYIGLWTFKRKKDEQNFYYLPITFFYMIKNINKNYSYNSNSPYELNRYEKFVNYKVNENEIQESNRNLYNEIQEQKINETKKNSINTKKKWEFFKTDLLDHAKEFDNDEFKQIKMLLSEDYLLLANISKKQIVDRFLLNKIIDNEIEIDEIYKKHNLKYANNLLDGILNYLLKGENIIYEDERFKEQE